MHKSSLIIRYISVLIMAVSLLGGCALFDYFSDEEEEKGPAEIMNDGLSNMERGHYEAAIEDFQEIKDRYPYSKYALTAEIKMSDALFEKQEFEEAYETYDEFERLHPKSGNIPYVIYRKGMCNFLQVTAIDRDQSNTLKAREDFERLIRQFPRDDYAGRARKKIRRCLIYLSEYELYVGHYYYKMGKYRTAMSRYSHIIQNYPDMGQYHEAIEYISKCNQKLSKEKE